MDLNAVVEEENMALSMDLKDVSRGKSTMTMVLSKLLYLNQLN